MKTTNRHAQSFGEYAFVLAVVAAAFLSLQIYVKRAIQGNLRLSSENLGEQYSPQHTNSQLISTNSIVINEATTIQRNATEKRTINTINTTENTSRSINQTVVRQ